MLVFFDLYKTNHTMEAGFGHFSGGVCSMFRCDFQKKGSIKPFLEPTNHLHAGEWSQYDFDVVVVALDWPLHVPRDRSERDAWCRLPS